MLHTVEILHFQNALHIVILTKSIPKLVQDLFKVMVSVILSRSLEFGWSFIVFFFILFIIWRNDMLIMLRGI
jgi:hypothetical protein